MTRLASSAEVVETDRSKRNQILITNHIFGVESRIDHLVILRELREVQSPYLNCENHGATQPVDCVIVASAVAGQS